MCGRFVRHTKPSVYAQMFEVDSVPGEPSYNIAPTQLVAAVRMADDHRECVLLRWGLIPFWAKDKKTSFINARGDTVLQKPAFRASVKKRRCLVLADGYFEWKTEGKAKQPYYYRRRDEKPFAFAGLWDRWESPEQSIQSCTIITTDANELARPVHDRMPVILTREGCALWLDREVEDNGVLQELLVPYPAEELDAYPVSSLVGNVKNNRPECIERASSS
jgi:putative SOS response-associated peptidase YedK